MLADCKALQPQQAVVNEEYAAEVVADELHRLRQGQAVGEGDVEGRWADLIGRDQGWGIHIAAGGGRQGASQ